MEVGKLKCRQIFVLEVSTRRHQPVISAYWMVLAANHERHQLLTEADTATDADRLGQIMHG